MPVSPSIIKGLEDIIRTDLILQRDWYASCIFWSTLAVVVGCAMEVPEVLHELWPTLFAKRFERAIKWVASIGLGLVVLGVAGELNFEHWRSAYEGLLEDFGNILLVDAERQATEATEQAGSAAASSNSAASALQVAQARLGKLQANSSALDARVKTASSKLEKVEDAVRAQGPRWRQLKYGKDAFIAALKPFSGQKFAVIHCGPQQWEETSLEGDLLNFLGPNGAKWQQVGYSNFNPGGMCPALWVQSSKDNDATTRSGKALADTLNKLKIVTMAIPTIVRVPDFSTFPSEQIAPFRAMWDGSAMELLSKDPTLVVITVGQNPMVVFSEYFPNEKPPK